MPTSAEITTDKTKTSVAKFEEFFSTENIKIKSLKRWKNIPMKDPL